MQSLTFQTHWKSILSNTFRIFNVNIHSVTFNDSIDWILEKTLFPSSESFSKTTCHFVNADCLNTAYKDTNYRQILNSIDRVFADGSGVRLACKIKQLPKPENINGTDLFPALCKAASKNHPNQLRIFLLGGKPDVAEKVIKKMSKQYPNVDFTGQHHGYFDQQNCEDIIAKINESQANLLLVGMGAPYQEKWIQQYRDKIDTAVCMGVGGLFDYYSGNIPRAPIWLRNIGCEWVWRMMNEPKRLAKRYLVGNGLFIMRVLFECRQEKIKTEVSFNPTFNTRSTSPTKKRFQTTHFRNTYSMNSLFATLHKSDEYFQRITKRLIDISGAVIALAGLSPILLTTMVLIFVESPGNVFFSQQRTGKNGKAFKLWKFRSMHINAEQILEKMAHQNEMAGGVLFKIKQDPRITKVGKFIRKYSIDELPQLWNVLNGSMSLVGPRPALPKEVEQYQTKDRQRMQVKPGITCIWQVSGRSDIPFEQQIELDHLYISKRSLLTDIKLMLATIPAVLTARGAY